MMETKLLIDAEGVIVNRILVDANTPSDMFGGTGLTLHDDIDVYVHVPVRDAAATPPTRLKPWTSKWTSAACFSVGSTPRPPSDGC